MMKLIATDMDGTFLRPDHTYDVERFERDLAAMEEQEILFAVASGRPLNNLKTLFREYLDRIAIIAENGAVVLYKGELIFKERSMDRELIRRIMRELNESPYGSSRRALVSGLEYGYLFREVDPDYYELLTNYYSHLKVVDSLDDIDEEILKLVIPFDQGNFEEAQAWFNATFEGVSAVTTGIDSCDIILDGSHKAVGLQALCDHVGIALADTVAFGDNENDIEMLTLAGEGIAMGNALEAVKQVADRIIGTCEEDAVLAEIEHYIAD